MQAAMNKDRMRSWYVTHRDEYNERRRRNYGAKDWARESAVRASASYRERLSQGHCPEETVVREIKGKSTKGYSTGYVAKRINRSPQMIRVWEKNSLLPPSTFPDKHRYYSDHQVQLIQLLAHSITEYRAKKITKEQHTANIQKIHDFWTYEWD